LSARIVHLCDWLPPDFGAVGQYALEAARNRARAGAEVLLAGLSSRGDSEVEERHGAGRLRILRLASEPCEREHFVARAAWTLVTDLRLVAATLPDLARADTILFTGSPPLLVHLLVPLNLLLRRRLVYRITDFHPECLIAELGRAPLWLRLFLRWTSVLRRAVDEFEVLGEDQRRRLLAAGIRAERVRLERDDSPVPFPAGLEPLPRPAPLAGRLVLLYSGNFGLAHDDATFVEGYRRHHASGSGRVALWLNATGARADRVEARLRAEGLPVHRSAPVPTAELARLLASADAHLITLRDEFVGYVMPSKVYGCIRSGRPVLFVGSTASDVDLLCRERLPPGRYLRAAAGDPEAVAAALETLSRTVS
jgi:hypothetical protein